MTQVARYGHMLKVNVTRMSMHVKASCQLAGLGSSRPHALIGPESSRGEVVVSDETEQVAIESENYSELRPAKPDRAGHDRIEDGLNIRRRAANHPQDLARRRLLRHGFSQCAPEAFGQLALDACALRFSELSCSRFGRFPRGNHPKC